MCEQPKININRGLEESIIQFLVALWQRAMQQAQKQSTSDVEQRAEVIHKNILKINGFPIGELDLAVSNRLFASVVTRSLRPLVRRRPTAAVA